MVTTGLIGRGIVAENGYFAKEIVQFDKGVCETGTLYVAKSEAFH